MMTTFWCGQVERDAAAGVAGEVHDVDGEGEGDDVAVLQRYVDVGGSAVQPVDDGAGEVRHEPVLEGAGVVLPAGDDAGLQGVGHDGDVSAGDELRGAGGVVWVAVGDDEGLDGVDGQAHGLQAA